MTGETEGGVAVFTIDDSNDSIVYDSWIWHGRGGVNGVQNPIAIIVSPDSANVYVAGMRDNGIAVFSRDLISGELTYTAFEKVGEIQFELFGKLSLAASPDGKNLYVSSAHSDKISLLKREISTGGPGYALEGYTWNSSTGKVTNQSLFKDGVDGVDGLFVVGPLTVSPDNRYVYTIGTGDNALVVFNRDTVSGVLEFNTVLIDRRNKVFGLQSVNGLAVSPDSKNVYTISGEDNLTIFERTSTEDVESALQPLRQSMIQMTVNQSGSQYHLRLSVRNSAEICCYVSDVKGRVVKKMLNGYYPEGIYTVSLDFKELADGLYLLRLLSQKRKLLAKIIVTK